MQCASHGSQPPSVHPNPQPWRARAAGAHAAYLGELQSGALLGESDAELQRELSLLLRTLLLLEPPLRRLHQLVRPLSSLGRSSHPKLFCVGVGDLALGRPCPHWGEFESRLWYNVFISMYY